MIQEIDERQRFLAMIRQYDPLLMRICSVYGTDYRNPSEDLYQEIICHLWKHRDTLLTVEHPTSWIFRVARGVVISQHRSWFARNKMFVREPHSAQLSSSDDMDVVSDENVQHLQELMSHLNDEDRMLIVLYLEGYDNKAIAEAMNIAYGTVSSRIYRAKMRLVQLHNQLS